MKQHIAKQLLSIGAVSLSVEEPYTWSSGIRSPIYCDNRLTLSYPDVRTSIVDGFSSLVKTHFPSAEMIAGTATAGIPHAALLADALQLPMCYVRSSAKEHGKGKQIEGSVTTGMKVVVVEDLISTGGSVLKAVAALQEAGCEVLGIIAIFTYELQTGKERLQDAKMNVQTLSDYSTLIETAREEGTLTKEQHAALLSWRDDPTGWLQHV
ncbi:orotate phosphoribosyltransferase [Fictibacillus macauensis ZFHKF-1]|uniref:Orotate phosphoribosyltransferase n=1 Tax=Fictibacillus macauensis ZFHKF-1 TaxID=1196324 RepID=I8IZW9_9BACL|nr:orotate phosphoribosyltransferase [Fictibacillus macauensis]EIT85026.1 orotate phosphoribosyltransferase [Fictibacillus macauensis ZFHKF-1]